MKSIATGKKEVKKTKDSSKAKNSNRTTNTNKTKNVEIDENTKGKKGSSAIAFSISGPWVYKGDTLVKIAVDRIAEKLQEHGMKPKDGDVFALTESVVSIAQNNIATHDELVASFAEKFKDKVVGVVDPIHSRNRFMPSLKAISAVAKQVIVLLRPKDEQGNILTPHIFNPYDVKNKLYKSWEKFVKDYGVPEHERTKQDYWKSYEAIASNIKVVVSRDVGHIIKFTKTVLVATVHGREHLKKYLLKKGVKEVFTLADFMNKPMIENGAYQSTYGLYGANKYGESSVKLLPRDCDNFVKEVQSEFKKRFNVTVYGFIFGDGAIKDHGNWELADPDEGHYGTSPELLNMEKEIKVKDEIGKLKEQGFSNEEINKKISEMITNQTQGLGTTPKTRAILFSTVFDSLSGSGQKGRWMGYITER